MVDEKEGKRPTHSVEPSDGAERERGSHEVNPPPECVDDEVGSDDGKTTKRQE